MYVSVVVLLILITIGLVFIQNNIRSTVPVVIELPQVPIDIEKIERVKDIVEKLENEDTISVTTTANIETAKKIIAQSETKNIAIIANVVKVQATTKREASHAKVLETRKKIQAMDVASAQKLKTIKIKSDSVSKINNALDETVRKTANVDAEQKEKARILAEEFEEKKRKAQLRIQAAKSQEEQEKKDKAERMAAFRAKMAKYAGDKLAAEAEIAEKARKAKQARALEIALAKKAVIMEAEAEMKQVLEMQRLLQKDLKEKERLQIEAAEEARRIQLEENNTQMEEAKLKREEEEAETAEAQAVLDEEIQMQREEAEEMRLVEEDRMAEIEAERMDAEAEAASILEEEKERQLEMDEEDREIRIEQEEIIQELEEERVAEAEEAEEIYALEQSDYKLLQDQLADEEKEYLEDRAAEAIATKVEYDADIAANTAEQSASLAENVTASETAASALETETTNIQLTANLAQETSLSVSESGGVVAEPSGMSQEALKFFCLSAELTPETDNQGNTVYENGEIKYMAYGDDRRDTTQEPTIIKTTCVEECHLTRGGEMCEDVCTNTRVPNPDYVPPSTWDGVMSGDKCGSIDGFTWTNWRDDINHCVHDTESDPTFVKVANCITSGGTTHHGSYMDDEILNSLSVDERNAATAEQHAIDSAAAKVIREEKMYNAREDAKTRSATRRARIEKEKAAYLESLRSDCKYEYSKTIKYGLKQYADARGSGFKSSVAQFNAQKLLVHDPTAQHCLPCDPYTKEYLHILKEPSDPGKKSCPTEKIRKTACTPIISCDAYTAKMNAVTRDRHEALLALETNNKSELKDLLVYARAESKARGSYDRQVKRINTVITASQKTRYDKNVADKKVIWDDAMKEYNKEGAKLFSAYYDEVVQIPRQLHYCQIRKISNQPIQLTRTNRTDTLSKKYFGNKMPYDYTVAGEGVYIAPDKYAIMASTTGISLLSCKSDRNRFSSSIRVNTGPGYVNPPNGKTEIVSNSSSVKVKDSYYNSCTVKAKKGYGEPMDNSSTQYSVVHDSSNGTTYILQQGRRTRNSTGRREINKQQGSFKIEAGGKLVLIHAKKARKEEHVTVNGVKQYQQKFNRTYDKCMRRSGRYQRCQGGYKYTQVNDTSKPIKNYTYYRRQDQRTELYNFNDTNHGYTLVANFATNDYWLMSTNGKYYSVTDNKVHRIDKSLRCKTTKPVISNAIGGYGGMKKHLADCLSGLSAECVDVYQKKAALSRVYQGFKSYSYDTRMLYDQYA